MKTRDEVIGTPSTDENGWAWCDNHSWLVIRRNAPVEPSVEELRKEIERLQADTAEIDRLRGKVVRYEEQLPSLEKYKQQCGILAEEGIELRRERDEWKAHFGASEAQVGKLDAKVAELEKVVKNLQDEHYRNISELNATSRHNSDLAIEASTLKAKVAALEAENVRLGGLTGVVHDQEETIRWHKLNHSEHSKLILDLKAKVAELEEKAATLCRDWERQTDAIRQLKESKIELEGEVNRITKDRDELKARVAERDETIRWYKQPGLEEVIQ